MRKKYFVFWCLVAAIFLPASANPVGREQARRAAVGFAKTINLHIDTSSAKSLSDMPSVAQFQGFYVFTGSDGKGFVIVSADDCTIPILGYSDTNPFPHDTLSESVHDWLQGYDEAIQFYRRNNFVADNEVRSMWQTLYNKAAAAADPDIKDGSEDPVTVEYIVAPLIQTKWDQQADYWNWPPTYNKFCPLLRMKRYCPDAYGDVETVSVGRNALTGCVATATAQVMKYWNWPPHGRGSHSYTNTYNEEFWRQGTGNTLVGSSTGRQFDTTISANFADTVFHWSFMPNALTRSSGSDSVDAVASLMSSVGIALEMQYGVSSSGAITAATNVLGYHTVEEVLRDYFYYSYSTTSVYPGDFTDDEWKALLRHELDAGRPVIYAGSSSPSSGHCFVCDGYAADGTFSFNWGWGGYCDGCFAIGNLTPGTGGSGAGTGSYNLYGKAVIGIEPAATCQPETGTTIVVAKPNHAQYGSVTGSGTYDNWDTTVVLRAVPNDGYSFSHWSDGCRYNPRRLVASGGSQTYTAVFVPFQGDFSYIGTVPEVYMSYGADGTTPEWGIRIPASALVSATALESVLFIGNAGTYTLKVYGGGTSSPQTCIYTSNDTTLSGLSRISISIPHEVTFPTGQDVWITLTSPNGSRYVLPKNMTTTNDHWDKKNGIWVNRSSAGYSYLIKAKFAVAASNPVDDLTVSSITPNGATLSWSEPDGNPDSYTLAYGVGYSPEQAYTVTTSSTSYTLTALHANTEYRVWVRANYSNRQSLWNGTAFVTNNFSNPVRIIALADDELMGFVSGGGVYEQNSTVTLCAIPMVGYAFTQWEDNQSTVAERQVTATADAVYIALFTPQCYPFSATTSDATLGTVTVEGDATPSGFPYLSTVMLNAEPIGAAVFSHWNDGNTTNPRYCTVLETNPEYTAYFTSSAKGGVSLVGKDREVNICTVEPQTIEVFDMLGRRIFLSREGRQITTVTLPAAGVYLVRVGSTYSEKIIIR